MLASSMTIDVSSSPQRYHPHLRIVGKKLKPTSQVPTGEKSRTGVLHSMICFIQWLNFFSISSHTSRTHSLQTLHQIDNALLQSLELDAQNINNPAVVVLIKALSRIVTSLDILARQLLCVLREVLPDNLDHFFVAEIAGCDEEAFVSCFWDFDCLYVCLSIISIIPSNRSV